VLLSTSNPVSSQHDVFYVVLLQTANKWWLITNNKFFLRVRPISFLTIWRHQLRNNVNKVLFGLYECLLQAERECAKMTHYSNVRSVLTYPVSAFRATDGRFAQHANNLQCNLWVAPIGSLAERLSSPSRSRQSTVAKRYGEFQAENRAARSNDLQKLFCKWNIYSTVGLTGWQGLSCRTAWGM